MYDVHISLQKIHRWLPAPLSKRTFENLGYEQMDGLEDRHEYLFIYSNSPVHALDDWTTVHNAR